MSALFPIAGLAALLVLLGLSAFFSACETVLYTLTPFEVQRLREQDRHAGRRVAGLLANQPRALSTILIGNTLVNVAFASLGYALISHYAPRWGEVIAIPAVTLALLLFGELAPKRVARSHAARLAPAASRVVGYLQRLFAPLSALLEVLTRFSQKYLTPERSNLNDEELLTLVEVGAEQGAIDEGEQTMVDGILRLSELQASDIMTPRVDMIGIDTRDPPATHLETARHARLRRLPVYNRTVDAIEGFLDVPRYLVDPEHALRRHLTTALFVPENVALDDLLITMQKERRQIACVLDEYGGTAGLITRGDILELLTGGDEPSLRPEVQSIRQTGAAVWIIDGKTSLEEINHELDLNLEADGADRISGWCAFHAGKLLRAGEVVAAQGCQVQVLKLRKRRIDQVQLELQPAATDGIAAEAGPGDGADFDL